MKNVLGLVAVAGLLAAISPAQRADAMGPTAAAMNGAPGAAGSVTEAPVVQVHWHHHHWHHHHWHRWHHHRHW